MKSDKVGAKTKQLQSSSTTTGQTSDVKRGVGPLFKVTDNSSPGSVESGLELETQVVSTSL